MLPNVIQISLFFTISSNLLSIAFASEVFFTKDRSNSNGLFPSLLSSFESYWEGDEMEIKIDQATKTILLWALPFCSDELFNKFLRLLEDDEIKKFVLELRNNKLMDLET